MEEKKTELALRLKTLEQALVTLEEALAQPFSVIVRDATIQRFEYTYDESTAAQVFESAGRLPASLWSAIKRIRQNYLR